MDIVYQLVNGLSGLPAQESRLARFFLDNFAQIPEASIEELAAKAGVSPATLQHFSRSIGCADLNDFIGQVRHQQQENRVKTTAAPMLGDAAWVDAGTLQKLAKNAGIGSDILDRFSHSIGRDGSDDILSLIHQRLQDFSQQESRVAQTILSDVAFAASATIDQLATAAGVSPATITRFARAAGCDDIRDLRMKLAQASAPVASGDMPGPWRERLNQIQYSLNAQLHELSPAAVERAASLLKQAKAVHIFSASTADNPFASVLQYRLLTQGYPANVCQDPALMGITASMLGAGQVLVVFAGTPPGSALIAAVHQARWAGADIIVIGQQESALSHQQNVTLPLNDSRYGSLLIVDLICDSM
ncbi:TPA: MurR/RpiR family transcriptional regulator [Kluyvera georgiana]|uniref:MurR/RpiR family transcriptional regulator n=1 Tax=Kluyvera georgiana TaxID=73098 RepID=UPI0023045983|nr:MurR/RpiR family transcriptional regulator [Kluyvera georgiana]MDA8493155.1 MurR/RpiR family transcriptional regulator [Kluyvera georgiana]HDG1693130.1 MurR/RpiR family transcriptional regulator [Kluyvera georgiana]